MPTVGVVVVCVAFEREKNVREVRMGGVEFCGAGGDRDDRW